MIRFEMLVFVPDRSHTVTKVETQQGTQYTVKDQFEASLPSPPPPAASPYFRITQFPIRFSNFEPCQLLLSYLRQHQKIQPHDHCFPSSLAYPPAPLRHRAASRPQQRPRYRTLPAHASRV